MRPKHLSELEMTVATELSSTTITNILEAVPGIKTVLRSPAADAMVNLTRAAAGVGPFELKDARELMRFAFRRGLINNEEHDRVLLDVEGATAAKEQRLAARKAARAGKGHGRHRPAGTAPKARKAKPAKKAKPAAKKKAAPKKKLAPKKKPAPKKSRVLKKAKPAAKKTARKTKPAPKKARVVKKRR